MDWAEVIARRAEEEIGTAFKLHGRRAGEGLDCVGLTGHAVAPLNPALTLPKDYNLRGDFTARIDGYLKQVGLTPAEAGAAQKAGDILLVHAGQRQQHLMIACENGLAHAHAGLRRVVMVPMPPAWPILYRWRFTGD